MIQHPIRQRIEAGEVAIGAGVYLCWNTYIAPVMRQAGFHWLFLDLEHNAMNLETAAQITGAALGAGIAPVVRVPTGDYGLATRLLDAGALGVVMPHIDTEADAAEMVARLRYPPLGRRSCGYASPLLEFRQVPAAESMRLQDEAVLLIALLETGAAVRNADAIAAVQGIDVLMIGTLDLSIDLGIAGQFGHPDIDEAYATVAAACRRHGKTLGMAGITAPDQVRRYVDQGARLMLAASDLSLLAASAAQRLQDIGRALA